MALHFKKTLLAVVAGLTLTTAVCGTTVFAAEADTDSTNVQTSIAEADSETTADTLTRFIVSENGTKVLTGLYNSDDTLPSGWYVTEDGSLYYYYSDGSYATNKCVLPDGNTYLFSQDGVLKTGWQTVDGKRFYYNVDTGMQVTGWMTYGGNQYYIDETEGKLKGEQTINGVTYAFDSYGCLMTGMLTFSDGSIHAFESDGTPAQGWVSTETNAYYFVDGTAATGNVVIDGINCYIDSDYQLMHGWFTVDGATFYADQNGELLTGIVTIENKTYDIDPTSGVKTGWVTYSDGTAYYNTSGVKQYGIQIINEQVYYFDTTTGYMLTGWQQISNAKLLFDSKTGAMVTGWYNDGNGTMYLTESGISVGFNEIDGSTYYFDTNGYLQTGMVSINNKLYQLDSTTGEILTGWYTDENGHRLYFTENGMTTGISNIDGFLYYFDENGYQTTGWIVLNQKTYYFNEATGYLSYNVWIAYGDGKRFLNEDGVMATGLTVISGNIYYFDETTGYVTTGWKTINQKTYYFNETSGAMTTSTWMTYSTGKRYLTDSGAMATGLTTIDGSTYYFNPSTGLMQTGWVTINGTSYYFDDTTGIETQSGHAPVQLDVVSYKQFDSQWANKKITYSTIGKVGCLVTALSMKYSYETGNTTTPDQMVSKLSFNGDSLQWSACTALGYTVKDVSGTISQSVMQTIYNLLLEGTPVVIGAKTSSGGQHYVTITGYAGSIGSSFNADNFIINDPGSSTRTTLSAYLSAYPNLYKLIY